MLTEKRYELILELLDKKRSVTVPEIKEVLGVSESTIRRDLNALDKAGRLTKVFGGAVSSDGTFTGTEPSVAQKMELQQEEKRRIAQFAAGLIQPDDFVYLDAGTTTGYILDYLPARSATFVTNAVSHAKRLAAAGNRVILIGGELKGTTEAVIGSQAILMIQSYHFTKGFFGTNGVSKRHGFTTPDPNDTIPILVFVPTYISPVTDEFIFLAYTPIELLFPSVIPVVIVKLIFFVPLPIPVPYIPTPLSPTVIVVPV